MNTWTRRSLPHRAGCVHKGWWYLVPSLKMTLTVDHVYNSNLELGTDEMCWSQSVASSGFAHKILSSYIFDRASLFTTPCLASYSALKLSTLKICCKGLCFRATPHRSKFLNVGLQDSHHEPMGPVSTSQSKSGLKMDTVVLNCSPKALPLLACHHVQP